MGVLTNEEYRLIVQNFLNTSDFDIVECSESEEKGSYESFSGMTVQISLTISHLQKGILMNLSFFLKQYPLEEDFHKELIKSTRIFFKETNLYNGLLKDLNSKVKGKIFAKSFLSKPNELLVLEDLSEASFKKKHLFDTFDISECEMAMGVLAKLHSASIIYETDKNIKLNEKYPDVFFEPVLVTDQEHIGFHYLCVGINATESIIDAYFPHFSREVCEKMYNLMRGIPEKLKPSKKHRNVLNHGNLWGNNVMFSYNYEGKVEEARIIDFKFVRYSPPALDVLLFLYMTTSHALRESDMESLLIFYYNKLGRELAEAGVDIHGVVTWQDFMKSVEEVRTLAMAMTVLSLQFYLIPHERVLNLLKHPEKYKSFIMEDRSQIVLDVMRTEECFRRRVTQSITDLIDQIKKQ